MLSQQLIENALALCGKTMDFVMNTHNEYEFYFDDAIFFKFLLSPEFIKKYSKLAYGWSDLADINKSRKAYGLAIGKYQSGNEKPLIKLLSKINGK